MTSVLELADGRLLEHVEYGDPQGLPVLYFHGTPGTATVAELCDEDARASGVRVIATSRPGFGRTTTTAPGLGVAARDCLELADHLGLDRFATHGSSGGGPSALALAAVASDRVSVVLLAASPGPIPEVEPDSLEDVDRRALALVDAGDVEGAAAVLAEHFEEAFAPFRAAESDEEVRQRFEAFLPPGEGDNRLSRDPRRSGIFWADLRRAVAVTEGMVRDNLSWVGRWDFDLAAVQAPVLLYYGARDQMVPMGAAEWLAHRLPTSELVVLRDADHGATCYDHLPEQYQHLARFHAATSRRLP